MVKLSIIIPIYNLENYLEKCLDSIVCQDCQAIEVILVNDDSMDNSGAIADEYASYYSFISVIHQKNQGVSVARNQGLLKSGGEYVWFVDGDDWIGEQAISKILTLCQSNSDIVFIGSMQVIGDYYIENNHKDYSILSATDLIDNFEYLLSKNIIKYFPWDKIVKRDLLIENQLFFDKNYTIGEDYFWTVCLLNFSQTFVCIDDPLYYYRKFRNGAATEKVSVNNTKKSIKVLQDSIEYIKKNHQSENKNLILFSSMVWFGIIPNFIEFDPKERKEYYAKMYEIYQVYIKEGLIEKVGIYNRGAKLLHKIVGIFGWRYGYFVYGCLINIRRSKFGFWLLNKLGG